MTRFTWVQHKPHVKVRGEKSPFDGDHVYWGQRLTRYAGLSLSKQTLLKRQKGVCPFCKQAFLCHDVWNVDHVVPKRFGGKHGYSNLQLLHLHRHNLKTRADQRPRT